MAEDRKTFPLPTKPAPSGGEKPPEYSKGEAPREASYATGGLVLGRTRDFLKTPDAFRENKGNPSNFGKGSGKDTAPAAHGKSLPAVKPKS